MSLPFRIFETRQFLKDLALLGQPAQTRLESKLREFIYPLLRDNPYSGSNIRQLKNWQPPTWRVRVGDWRFFYEIDAQHRIVFMTSATHRREAYRD